MVNFAFGELFMLGAFLTATLMMDQVTLFGHAMAMPGMGFGTAAALAMAMVAALGGLCPQELLDTADGREALGNLLTQMQFGVYA